MEGYSIFSSSTNSSTSSPTNSNFPFSLSQVTSASNSFDHYQDHHHGNNQSGPLITEFFMMDEHQQQQQIQPPMNNNYHDLNMSHNHQVNDDQNKRNVMVNGGGNNNNSKLIKKGSLEKKVKKHRYAFQTRSQVDILDDGYRWRKYGQKAVKNNKFPRSYYRCTYQGCNVKKQVQRLSNDDGVVVTTYEGIHSHSTERSTDNFEHILTQMQIYTSF